MGNWWLAASSWQSAHSCITSCVEFFGKTSNHPGDSAPLQPIFGALWLLAFPQTKITFEREEISDHWWDSGKYNGAADSNSNKGFCRVFWTVEETLGGLFEVLRCLLWRGLRHHCPMYMYFVFSSINVSIFDVTWLDTFWTDLVYSQLPKIPDVVEDKDRSTGNYNILQQTMWWKTNPHMDLFLSSDPSPSRIQQVLEECKIISWLAKTNLQGEIPILTCCTHPNANNQICLDFLLPIMICSSVLYTYGWMRLSTLQMF